MRRIFCRRQGAMTCRGDLRSPFSGGHHARKSNAADGEKTRPSRTPPELGLPARAGLGESETLGARRAGARNDAGTAHAAGGSRISVGRPYTGHRALVRTMLAGPCGSPRAVDDPDFPDADVAAAWNAAQDQDVEPELSPEWFPAWMLLQEPSLAARLAPSGKNDGPRRAFDLVQGLLTNRANVAHRIALRRELKTLHPALLTGSLNRFAGN